ncbi:Calmodulin-binding transcription activator 4, partial [Sarracenia purpurea var. burkii]
LLEHNLNFNIDIAELQGRDSSGSVSHLSPGSTSTFIQSPRSYTAQHPGSTAVINELYKPYQSPGSEEDNSDEVIKTNGMDLLDRIERMVDISNSSELEFSKALQRLEEELSLDDDSLKEIDPLCRENGNLNDSEYILNDKCTAALPDDLSNPVLQRESGGKEKNNHQAMAQEFSIERNASLSWKEMLEFYNDSPGAESQEGKLHPCHGNVTEGPISSLTNTQKQKFTIREICPEWGYASEATKVVIAGSFICDSSEVAWTCMFGDVEVPVQIIQEGVICCQAPPHPPGKVNLCITSCNLESCSEIREFEYRVNPSSCARCSSSQTETTKSPEELLLLVKFVQMLLSDPLFQKGDVTESVTDLLAKVKASEDLWGHVIEALSVGSWTSSNTTDWLLQELLKDKLQLWLSLRSKRECDWQGCLLSKKEQGVIHMVAGLGFEWALNPILISGVNVNFRDINGWTALHWAARFGRENTVAALIVSGASAGAVTDPSSQDPTGKTPASIAATGGHRGLAGYLSELALTSHLSSLTLEENELSKGTADVEAEIAVNSVSQWSLTTNEDQFCLKDTLAAVRNASQAASRIQAAFRAHSFRKRQQREADAAAAAAAAVNEYNVLSNDIPWLSAASKLGFRNCRNYNKAALAIQKSYRGWKGRKDYLAVCRKVVTIQAHFRGYQVRKHYKIICWAVGILEKVILRWRRKGIGLRGFRHDMESIDESEDEDILKVFRKQKVDKAMDEAVSRVLSMVDCPEARHQYRRMLERYRQAKAELNGTRSVAASTSKSDTSYMENEGTCQYP